MSRIGDLARAIAIGPSTSRDGGNGPGGNPVLPFDEWLQFMSHGGLQYPYPQLQTTLGGDETQEIGGDFHGLVQGAYKSNGVVFACELARMALFSEATFQFRRRTAGRPGDLFGTKSLERLESPWPNATTGDLLTRMLQDADLAGNWYGALRPDGIRRLRPDWVTIVKGSKHNPDHPAFELDLELIGYLYHPGGIKAESRPIALGRDEVAHFAPIPDPEADFRGMSWLTPVIREIMGDQAATNHKLKYFDNGATPNLVVSLDPSIDKPTYDKWVEAFDEQLTAAYATLYLGGGADVTPVGSSLKEVSFKETQGAGETRIAAAAGVPPVIVGLSEGLQAATYSNYSQARRRFTDGTMRPLWRNAAGSLATITRVPAGAQLWYDDRDIAFLQDDMKERAEVQQTQAQAIKALVEAGYTPESAQGAVTADDFTLLKHSGLVSVQLTPPGEKPAGDEPPADPSKNGNGGPPVTIPSE